jgi:hypothetical protein
MGCRLAPPACRLIRAQEEIFQSLPEAGSAGTPPMRLNQHGSFIDTGDKSLFEKIKWQVQLAPARE